MHKVVTIAGSDTSGGAGILADVKVFQKHRLYPMTILTSIVTQTSSEWKHEVHPVDIIIIEKQMDTVFDGIGGIDAIKTGLLPTTETIECVARKLSVLVKAKKVKYIVIDPVMKCKGDEQSENDLLNTKQIVDAYIKYLLPLATVVTPNLFEAGQLAKTQTPTTVDDMKNAAKTIYEYGVKNVIIKGGGDSKKSVNLLYDGKNFDLIEGEYVDTKCTHGTGCVFSACITAQLANGKTNIQDAVRSAKEYVANALKKTSFKVNDHVGTMTHE
ncbi:unnamed protein product [Didymodactylos carnosus]|uniref:PN/PL/PM kinase n=1 Tax=Didymodactylos carnosus TaxID=1234261 RepID=A0A813XJA1_9BILA|nr:unnamed protein product [Didymodactylos carnosus]CAF0867708.1 unnamed protein product [Didymodactylos carnosus]CAF3514411.1 unnamed protein product [Didymodactylos carnosus]CAF3655170.1 unnamed protein product [Didymodactylos carnosus]